jgi:hypothetical protein
VLVAQAPGCAINVWGCSWRIACTAALCSDEICMNELLLLLQKLNQSVCVGFARESSG